jgi:hypothetical protein
MADDKIVKFPAAVKVAKTPRLITPTGDFIPPVQRPEYKQLPPKPIQAGEGEHWKSAVDLLKELIVDIEHGRIPEPECMYVAMQCRDPKSRAGIARPGYSWTTEEWKLQGRLLMIGLLTHHASSL